jgi:hypothetical protein
MLTGGDVVVVGATVDTVVLVAVSVCVVVGVIVETEVPVDVVVVPISRAVGIGVPVVVLGGAAVGVPVSVWLPVTAMVPVTITVPVELPFDGGGTVCVQPAARRQHARTTMMIAIKEIRSISSHPNMYE